MQPGERPVVVQRAFTTVPSGVMHHAEQGSGRPVLYLHQTPRSWREFEWLLPFLAEGYRNILVDMPGFGDSTPPAEWTIESLADGIVELVDDIGLNELALVGHHTGGYVAYEVAHRLGERVTHLVLSCVTYATNEATGPARSGHTDLDDATPADDGSHFLRLWAERTPFYPDKNRTELLQRTIADTLRATDPVAGHVAVAEYNMAGKEPQPRTRVLSINGDKDPSFAARAELESAVHASRTVLIDGGGVALPEQAPREFAQAIRDFLVD